MIAPPTVPHPPLPRADSLVDPRVGDAGPALLALEDGTVFPGIAFGAPVSSGGDLVVNTSQTGYQEIATDPSYAGQVVVMTYPLIGNYGRLVEDDQSLRPWLRALVVAARAAGVDATYRELASTKCHEAFLIEWDQLTRVLGDVNGDFTPPSLRGFWSDPGDPHAVAA